jgi:hypothetical protein
MPLNKVAEEIQHRIIHIFGKDMDGRRATNGGNTKLDRDPHFRDYVFFHEFFHGNDGSGLGASHQTGWCVDRNRKQSILANRLIGLALSHTISYRAVSLAAFLVPHAVRIPGLFTFIWLMQRSFLAPRSVARHYFDEHIETTSEIGDRTPYTPYTPAYSAISPSDLHTLEDISPDAL